MRGMDYRHFAIVCALGLWAATVGAREIHRGLGPEPDSLDIHAAQGLASLNLLRDLREGLVSLDAAGRPVPGVAASWTVSENRTTWTFVLDPAARWSSGEPVTAGDFVRAWRAALDPATAAPLAGLLEGLANARAVRAGRRPPADLGVAALDDRRLRVTLTDPLPWLEHLLAHPAAYPLAAEPALTNGAFRLAEHVPGSHLKLVADPHYRAADAVAVDRVVWHTIEDPAVELGRYRAGGLHITESVPPGRVDWLRERMNDQLRVSPYLGSFFLGYNLSRPPFESAPALREALSLAIDREVIAERVIGAGEIPAWRLVPPNTPGWPVAPGPGETLSDADRLERARRLYRQAGYGPDRPLEVELRYNSSLTHRRVAAAVAGMWKQALGVRTRQINEEWKVFVTNRRQGRLTEVFRGGWIADYPDAASFLEMFVSGSPLNNTFFADPEFDRLVRAAGAAGDDRLDLLWSAEQRLLEAHAIIPLYYYVSRHLVDPHIKGFEDNPMDIHLSRWLRLGPDEAD